MIFTRAVMFLTAVKTLAFGVYNQHMKLSRFFGFSSPAQHRIITTANIDNSKFKVVLLPTVGASSFLHDFLDRYLSAIAFHQLCHRNIRCVAALTFE